MIDLPHATRRRRGPRVALVVLGVLLVLVLLGGVVVAVKLPNASTDLADPPRGSLEVAVPARGDWPVGEFRIRLRDSMQIRHPDAAADVWQSPEDEAFLTAGTGDPWIIDDLGIVRVSDRLRETWPDQRIDSAAMDEEGAFVLEGTLSGGAGSIPYTLRFAPTESQRLDVSVQVDAPADRVYLSAGLEPDEGVHGFGAQSAAWNLRGDRIALVPREQGIGRGEQPLSFLVDMAESAAGGQDTTYFVSGVNVTDRSRSFAYRGDAFASADLRPDDRMIWEVWSSTAEFSLAAAATPRAAVAVQSGWTGSFIGTPAWAGTGLIAGLQGGTDEVRAKIATLQEAGVPLAAVWLQDWVGPRTTAFGDRLQWNWALDEEHYAGWDELVAELAEQGIRVLTYVNPMLAADSGAATAERGGRDLHAEAAELGYLVVNDEGEVIDADQHGFTAASVDLSNPDAREWLAQAIADEAVARGVTGWMADFAEGPPVDAAFDGDGIDWRVRWPGLWQEVNNRALELTELGGIGLVWYRSGGTQSAGVPVWIGDQTQDWSRADGLASTVPLVHSLSASGVAAVHGDIGGYTSVALPVIGDVVRDEELVVRWAEASLLQPVFRTHEGNRPDAAAQPATDPELAQQIGVLARLFAALQPERERLAANGAMAAAAQHPWMMNPTQHRLLTGGADDELQLGPDLLLAPVLEPGKDSVAVTLPPGRWRHLWTGRIYGNEAGVIQVVVPAPVGEPAVFAREGSAAQGDFSTFRAAEEEREAAEEEATAE